MLYIILLVVIVFLLAAWQRAWRGGYDTGMVSGKIESYRTGYGDAKLEYEHNCAQCCESDG